LAEFRSLLREPHAVLDQATDLLEVPRFTTYPELSQKMAAPESNPGTRPSVAAMEGLVRRYADDLALFARLSGRDRSGWPPRRAAAGPLELPELRARLCARLGLPACPVAAEDQPPRTRARLSMRRVEPIRAATRIRASVGTIGCGSTTGAR